MADPLAGLTESQRAQVQLQLLCWVAYRRLLEVLNLSDAEVQEAEWAGRQALELSGTHWL